MMPMPPTRTELLARLEREDSEVLASLAATLRPSADWATGHLVALLDEAVSLSRTPPAPTSAA